MHRWIVYRELAQPWSTAYLPGRNIEKDPEGVALRLRQRDVDSNFTVRGKEYQQYLRVRDYKP